MMRISVYTSLVLSAALAVAGCGGGNSDTAETTMNDSSAMGTAATTDMNMTGANTAGDMSGNMGAVDVGAGQVGGTMDAGGTGLDSVTGVGVGAGTGTGTGTGAGATGTTGAGSTGGAGGGAAGASGGSGG